MLLIHLGLHIIKLMTDGNGACHEILPKKLVSYGTIGLLRIGKLTDSGFRMDSYRLVEKQKITVSNWDYGLTLLNTTSMKIGKGIGISWSTYIKSLIFPG